MGSATDPVLFAMDAGAFQRMQEGSKILVTFKGIWVPTGFLHQLKVMWWWWDGVHLCLGICKHCFFNDVQLQRQADVLSVHVDDKHSLILLPRHNEAGNDEANF